MYLELVRMHTHAHTNLEECCNRGAIILSFAVLELLKVQSLVISFSFSTGLVPRPHFFYIHSVALRCICMLSHQEFVTVRVCSSHLFIQQPPGQYDVGNQC